MEPEKLLEVIQVQRHDFLNHLQVISGFVQLNKPDRVREYIEAVTFEMRELSKTSRFKIPGVTAALLVGVNEAAKYQAEMRMTVNSTLDECAMPGPLIGEAMESVLNCYFKNLAPYGSGDRNFTVRFAENKESYTISLSSTASCISDAGLFQKGLEAAKELLQKHGGTLETLINGDSLVIFLVLPRKRVQIGQTTG